MCPAWDLRACGTELQTEPVPIRTSTDDVEDTAAEEIGEQVKDSVTKGLKKIFGN